MLEVMFILLISVLFVPPAQQSPFLYVNGLLFTSFWKAEIFVKYTFIYIIQLHVFYAFANQFLPLIFFVVLPFL